MTLTDILTSIDGEITRLQEARLLLTGLEGASPKVKASAATKPRRKKRGISAEGRARIAEAQRKRWAAQKKATK